MERRLLTESQRVVASKILSNVNPEEIARVRASHGVKKLVNFFMYYVYVLFSLKDKDFYVGKTADLNQRLEQHEYGRVDSTKDRRPLKFVYAEMTATEADAGHREIYLKTAWGKRYLKGRLKDTLNAILN